MIKNFDKIIYYNFIFVLLFGMCVCKLEVNFFFLVICVFILLFVDVWVFLFNDFWCFLCLIWWLDWWDIFFFDENIFMVFLNLLLFFCIFLNCVKFFLLFFVFGGIVIKVLLDNIWIMYLCKNFELFKRLKIGFVIL